MKKIVSLAVVLFLCAVIAQAEEVRTWTSGKFKTEAEFVKVSEDGKTVTLKKPDGKEVHVALNKLSKADQDFVAIKQKAPPIKKIDLSDEVFRVWTTDTVKIEAKFMGVSDDGKTVTLKKNDGIIDAKDNGEEIAVALDKLSPEDQEFVAIKQQAPEALDSLEAVARRKATLLKKIDLLNDPGDGKGVIVKLSDEEKDGVVQCLMLAEKAFGKELSDLDLRGMLRTMWRYKFSGRDAHYGGVWWLSSDGSKGSDGRSPTTKIDVYIACWALYDANYFSRDQAWPIIVPLFPVCNKLAGGIHDDKEANRRVWQYREDRKNKLMQEIQDMR